MRRRIKSNVRCTYCGREETSFHRLWGCAHSKCFWSHVEHLREAELWFPDEECGDHKHLSNWLLDRFVEMESDDLNLLVISGSHARRVFHLLQEWSDLKQPRQPAQSRQGVSWSSPPQGWIKANADGSFLVSNLRGAGGVVLRNHGGNFIGGTMRYFPKLTDPSMAELMACRRAVHLAEEMGIKELFWKRTMWVWGSCCRKRALTARCMGR